MKFRPDPTSPLKLLALALVPTIAAPVAMAQEEPEVGWKNEAELSFVATDGNAESSSLGFGAKFERKWSGKRFEASLGGVRAESSETSRTAVLVGERVTVQETSESELTAENYHAKARLDHDFAEHWFWHGGAGWERDQFAGIDHRFQGVLGIGRTLRDSDDQSWRIDAGLTWTGERLTAGGNLDFAGVRFSSDWSKQVTESTKLEHFLQIDENLDDTDDYRADTKFSLHVAMSKRLAIKTALQVKYDNQPALEELDVVDENGDATDGLTVLEPLDETDLKATVSLVVNF